MSSSEGVTVPSELNVLCRQLSSSVLSYSALYSKARACIVKRLAASSHATGHEVKVLGEAELLEVRADIIAHYTEAENYSRCSRALEVSPRGGRYVVIRKGTPRRTTLYLPDSTSERRVKELQRRLARADMADWEVAAISSATRQAPQEAAAALGHRPEPSDASIIVPRPPSPVVAQPLLAQPALAAGESELLELAAAQRLQLQQTLTRLALASRQPSLATRVHDGDRELCVVTRLPSDLRQVAAALLARLAAALSCYQHPREANSREATSARVESFQAQIGRQSSHMGQGDGAGESQYLLVIGGNEHIIFSPGETAASNLAARDMSDFSLRVPFVSASLNLKRHMLSYTAEERAAAALKVAYVLKERPPSRDSAEVQAIVNEFRAAVVPYLTTVRDCTDEKMHPLAQVSSSDIQTLHVHVHVHVTRCHTPHISSLRLQFFTEWDNGATLTETHPQTHGDHIMPHMDKSNRGNATSLSFFEDKADEFDSGLYFETREGGRMYVGEGLTEAAFHRRVHGVAAPKRGRRWSLTLYSNETAHLSAVLMEAGAARLTSQKQRDALQKLFKRMQRGS